MVADIAACYAGPRRVVRRQLKMGTRDDRALAILMAGCLVVFVAQWPRLARQAQLTGEELNPLLGGTLLAWLFIMPLVFYALAFLSWIVMRLLGSKGGAYGARMVLFWALLASSPLVLLTGLVAGFGGPGPVLSLVGLVWLLVFVWFWLSGLAEAWNTP